MALTALVSSTVLIIILCPGEILAVNAFILFKRVHLSLVTTIYCTLGSIYLLLDSVSSVGRWIRLPCIRWHNYLLCS